MKIGFCGTMSVGKTTLVNALKETKEFKNYDFRTERSKYLSSLGIPLNTDSTLKGQTVFLSERTAELILDNIITDRTVLDVMAFTNNAKSISVYKADKFETIIRFENLIQDWNSVLDKYGLPSENPLPHFNKSKGLDYWRYYDAETRGIVTELYKEDLLSFDYRF